MSDYRNLDLSNFPEQARREMANAAYGENVGQPEDVLKMTVQSMINRYLSDKKEFTTKDVGMTGVLKKGYYAVNHPNQPYLEALSQKFHDADAQAKYNQIRGVVDNLLNTKDYGDVQFYFTADEVKKLKKKGGFDFSKVKQTGQAGKYFTYSYK